MVSKCCTNHPGTYGGGAARDSDGQSGRMKIYDETFTSLMHDISGGSQNTSVNLV